MALRARLTKFFTVGCNLNQKLNATECLAGLTDNDESNYELFENFSRACSSTLLCIMYKLGHCDGDKVLSDIILRLLKARYHSKHEEEDAGGYIADFLRHNGNDGERVKNRPVAAVLPIRREQGRCILIEGRRILIARRRLPRRPELRQHAEEAPEGVPAPFFCHYSKASTWLMTNVSSL